jgi:hypothetical protein
MKIYIATSWQMEGTAILIGQRLREAGHLVDCFCEKQSGRYVFYWLDLVNKENELGNHDAKSFIDDPRVKRAFREEKNWLDWADVCVLIVPSDRSAHLEAGYAKGQGKKLFVLGGFIKGQFDVMYNFADGLYRWEEFDKFLEVLNEAK